MLTDQSDAPGRIPVNNPVRTDQDQHPVRKNTRILFAVILFFLRNNTSQNNVYIIDYIDVLAT
jgi:hypothetical protein